MYLESPRSFRLRARDQHCPDDNRGQTSMTSACKAPQISLRSDRFTSVRAAIMGNVGMLIAFQVGHDDAEEFAPVFEHQNIDTLTGLDRGLVAVRPTRSGEAQPPFVGHTLPDIGRQYANERALISELSRQPVMADHTRSCNGSLSGGCSKLDTGAIHPDYPEPGISVKPLRRKLPLAEGLSTATPWKGSRDRRPVFQSL